MDKKIIESSEQDFPQELEELITSQIIETLDALGVDVRIAGDKPKEFEKSIKDAGVRWENLFFPLEPEKSGLYFYKCNILAKFIHIPRTEGVDACNFMGDRL